MEKYNRSYHRGTHFNCIVKVSKNGIEWRHAKLSDLSSGGLSFESKVEYEVGDELWFDLHIEGFLSEFDVKTKGAVRNKQRFADSNIYGTMFIGLSQDIKIRIDENVHRDRPVELGPYDR